MVAQGRAAFLARATLQDRLAQRFVSVRGQGWQGCGRDGRYRFFLRATARSMLRGCTVSPKAVVISCARVRA